MVYLVSEVLVKSVVIFCLVLRIVSLLDDHLVGEEPHLRAPVQDRLLATGRSYQDGYEQN
jgi:hypothetical protein